MDSLVSGRSGIGLHQKRKFLEMRNQYTLTDESGAEIGKVEQTRQTPVAFLLRLVSSLDVALPVTLSVTNSNGDEEINVHKPWFRWTVQVTDGQSQALGSVGRKMSLGNAVFSVRGVNGEEIGMLKSENWRARDFRLEDSTQREVARVTKKWRGLLSEVATDADSYAVTFDDLTDTQTRKLAIAAALAVDLTMKQKDTSNS